METQITTPDESSDHRRQQRIEALEREIDDRDETIRLLNEALSRALQELERMPRTKAA
jgi:uncharacterized coiled-coil protein SlyX